MNSVKDLISVSPSFAGASAAHRGVVSRITTMHVTVQINFVFMFSIPPFKK